MLMYRYSMHTHLFLIKGLNRSHGNRFNPSKSTLESLVHGCLVGLRLAPLPWIFQNIHSCPSCIVQEGAPLRVFDGLQKSSQLNLQTLNCVLHFLQETGDVVGT